MEKEMKPGITVGDKVVTPKGEWGVVSDFTELGTTAIVQIRRAQHTSGVFNETTWNQLWKPDQLRRVNIYDEAGERWRLSCTMKRLIGVVNGPYTWPVAPLRHRELWTQDVVNRFEEYCGSRSDKLTSEMDEKLNETESEFKVGDIVKTPPQPIFRLKYNNGSSGWEGCYFVLVAEDEREMLLREVDINEAKVGDRVMTLQKSNWIRDYSIGDEIINFLSARGANFTNKVVDNG